MRRDEGGRECERELIAGERETRSRWATRRARRLGSRRSVNRRERRMRRPRRARDRRRTAGRVPAQRRAERGGGGVRGEAVNGEHRAMRVSGLTATARGQSGPVSRRRHSHASPLLRLAPSDVDKMKRKERPNRRLTGTHTNSPTRNAHTRCARKTLFVFFFLQKTQIRPPRAPGSAGPERGRRRAPMATRAGGHVAALPLPEPPPRARARPRHVFTSRSQKTSKSLFAIRANSRRASAAHHLRGAIRLLERNRLVFGDRRR